MEKGNHVCGSPDSKDEIQISFWDGFSSGIALVYKASFKLNEHESNILMGYLEETFSCVKEEPSSPENRIEAEYALELLKSWKDKGLKPEDFG